MQIQEVMELDAPRCALSDTLQQAAERMCVSEVDVLPVCDAERRLVASISSRDVCRCACVSGRPLTELRVADALGSRTRFGRADDPVERVLEIMVREELWHLPIVDHNRRLAGIAAYHKVSRRVSGARDVLLIVPEATWLGDRLTGAGQVPTWTLVACHRELLAPDGRSVALSAAEATLLIVLAESPGRVIGREALTRRVMDREWDPSDRYVDVVVANLRKKFRERASAARAIRTVPNEGYALALQVIDGRRSLASPNGDTKGLPPVAADEWRDRMQQATGTVVDGVS